MNNTEKTVSQKAVAFIGFLTLGMTLAHGPVVGVSLGVGLLLLFVGYAQGWWLQLWNETAGHRAQVWARLRAWLASLRGEAELDPESLLVYDVIMGHWMDDGSVAVGNLVQMGSIGLWTLTGGGKTTLIHSMVYDLISYHSPEELRLVFVDLKDGVDFAIYHRLPHLMWPIAERVEEAEKLLGLLLQETANRANLFKCIPKSRLCNSLDRFHELAPEYGLQTTQLPRLLVIFDEISRFTRDARSLDVLIDLAERGRTYGISLLCSTQLPKVDAIPRRLRSQLPARIIGVMGDETDYHQIAGVYKSTYEGVTLRPGQFFVRLSGQGWRVMQGKMIPDKELERVALAVSGDGSVLSWDDYEVSERMQTPAVWKGSTNEQKTAMLREWLLGFEKRPTPEEFTQHFGVSERTYWNHVPAAWEALGRD